MNSLHDVTPSLPVPSFSFFWWMKAGAGFALGAWLTIAVTWVGLGIAGFSMLSTLARLALR